MACILVYDPPPPCIYAPPTAQFSQSTQRIHESDRPGAQLSAATYNNAHPPHDTHSHPQPNQPHRDPVGYSASPQSATASPETAAPPRNRPNSGAALLKCSVPHDLHQTVIPGPGRSPGDSVLRRRECVSA